LSDEEYVLLGISFNYKWCKKSEGSYLIGYRYALAGIAQKPENERVSHSFSLDLQNVTNHKNIFSQQYDNRSMGIRNTYQLGFFPNLLYKLQF
jgi:hypothetical protein